MKRPSENLEMERRKAGLRSRYYKQRTKHWRVETGTHGGRYLFLEFWVNGRRYYVMERIRRGTQLRGFLNAARRLQNKVFAAVRIQEGERYARESGILDREWTKC